MRIRALALLSAFALVALACGQKPGVHQAAVERGEVPAGGTLDGEATGAGGGVTGGDTGEVGVGAGGTGGAGGGGAGAAGGGAAGGGGGAAGGGGGGGGGGIPTGGDATGVSANQIVIGIHSPVTGAAPIRSDSFNTGKDLYWEKGNNGGPVTVHGRRVKVVFQNDNYNPSTAKSVCQTMAEGDKAFLLIGLGGTDQIKACADYAASRGIPYLSSGVVHDALAGRENYFPISMSYKQQVPLLADYIRKTFTSDQSRIVAIITDTANFDDTVDAFEDEFPQAAVIRPSKNARGSEYADDVCTGPNKRYDVVFPLTSPTFFLELEGSAACNPQYTGVGISMGLDAVASVGCRSTTGSMHGARFFSPVYAFVDAQKRDPDFVRAQGRDDIEFALWGVGKVLHRMFEQVGPNLTRERFMAVVEQMKGLNSGIWPVLNYSPNDHFGASQVHVVRANCNANRYETESFFVSRF